MKKSLYFVAAAAILFSACSNEDEVTENASNDLVPVEFDAPYLSLTRAEVITNTNFKEFGVYAYEQGTTEWAVYRTSNTVPNFFYNQKVEKGTDNKWTYSPVKYWSNNIGAKHSIFAYAPYSERPNVVFSLANDGPAIRYTAGKDDYDLLWADAKINQQKTDINEKIQFHFKHALSQVAFEVSTFVDVVHGTGHATSLIDDNTSVIIRSIKFVGGNVPSQGLLSLKDGKWTYEGMEEGVYEFVPQTITLDKENNNYKDNTTAKYVEVSKENMVIPTRENEKVNIQIVYDVVTIDQNNPKNNSTITNKITSTESFPLDKGTSYKFKLDLGLTTVKFDADVATWSSAVDQNVDLPNNSMTVTALNVNTKTATTGTTAPSAAGTETDGDLYIDTNAKELYIFSSSWGKAISFTGYVKTADKYYSVEAGATTELTVDNTVTNVEELKTKAAGYYLVGSTLYKVS